MLKAAGLQPDGILGHSVGELACGYADNSLSHEEAVLAAYWRGRCVKEAKLPPGGMAAVGRYILSTCFCLLMLRKKLSPGQAVLSVSVNLTVCSTSQGCFDPISLSSVALW